MDEQNTNRDVNNTEANCKLLTDSGLCLNVEKGQCVPDPELILEGIQSWSCQCNSKWTGVSDVVQFQGYHCEDSTIALKTLWGLSGILMLRLLYLLGKAVSYQYKSFRSRHCRHRNRKEKRRKRLRRSSGIRSDSYTGTGTNTEQFDTIDDGFVLATPLPGSSQTVLASSTGKASVAGDSVKPFSKSSHQSALSTPSGTAKSSDRSQLVLSAPAKGRKGSKSKRQSKNNAADVVDNNLDISNLRAFRDTVWSFVHSPLCFLIGSFLAGLLLLVTCAIKVATNQGIGIDLPVTLCYSLGYGLALLCSIPFNNDMFRSLSLLTMSAQNFNHVRRMVKIYQFINLMLCWTFAIGLVVVLVYATISNAVFAKESRSRVAIAEPGTLEYIEVFAAVPRDAPAVFLALAHNAICGIVCALFMIQLIHALRLARHLESQMSLSLGMLSVRPAVGDSDGATKPASVDQQSAEGNKETNHNENTTRIPLGGSSIQMEAAFEVTNSQLRFVRTIRVVRDRLLMSIVKFLCMLILYAVFSHPMFLPYFSYLLMLHALSMTDKRSSFISMYFIRKHPAGSSSTGTGMASSSRPRSMPSAAILAKRLLRISEPNTLRTSILDDVLEESEEDFDSLQL